MQIWSVLCASFFISKMRVTKLVALKQDDTCHSAPLSAWHAVSARPAVAKSEITPIGLIYVKIM